MTKENKTSKQENNKTDNGNISALIAVTVILFIISIGVLIWRDKGQVIMNSFCLVEFLCSETDTYVLNVKLNKSPNWLGFLAIAYLAYQSFVLLMKFDGPSDKEELHDRIKYLEIELETVNENLHQVERSIKEVLNWLRNDARQIFLESKISIIDELKNKSHEDSEET